MRRSVFPCWLLGLLLVGACAADVEDVEGSAQALGEGADLDEDGIPDALEERLLRRHRPYYELTKEGDRTEVHRPADAIAEIETSQLREMRGNDDVSAPIQGCGTAGDRHLVPAASVLSCEPETSFARNPRVTKYCLNHADARRAGVSLEEWKAKATGLYGHVTPDLVNGRAAYKLEYWQFWPFNNQDITVLGLGSFGDHEGDWTGVHVWVDEATGALVKLAYMIHGKDVSFTVPPGAKTTCTSCFVSLKGSKYDPNVGSIFDERERPKFDDNQAELWIDEAGAPHVKVYIERGGHEGWPGKWGRAEHEAGPVTIRLNAHSGGGAGWLTADVQDRDFNLGEVKHPLTPAARVILDFNGHWGCTNSKDVFGLAPQRRSPVGPSMHCQWRWPNGTSAPGCEH